MSKPIRSLITKLVLGTASSACGCSLALNTSELTSSSHQTEGDGGAAAAGSGDEGVVTAGIAGTEPQLGGQGGGMAGSLNIPPGGAAGNGGLGGNSEASGGEGSGGADSGGAAGNAGGMGGTLEGECNRTLTFEAEAAIHQVGSAEADGWAARPEKHTENFLVVQRFNEFGACSVTLTYHVMVGSIPSPEQAIGFIGVYDTTERRWAKLRDVSSSEFTETLNYVPIQIGPFSLAHLAGHTFDIDFYWYDVVHVRVDKIEVQLNP